MVRPSLQNRGSRRDNSNVNNNCHRIAAMADRSNDEGGNFVRSGRRRTGVTGFS
jgi:hypothetical protein